MYLLTTTKTGLARIWMDWIDKTSTIIFSFKGVTMSFWIFTAYLVVLLKVKIQLKLKSHHSTALKTLIFA